MMKGSFLRGGGVLKFDAASLAIRDLLLLSVAVIGSVVLGCSVF